MACDDYLRGLPEEKKVVESALKSISERYNIIVD